MLEHARDLTTAWALGAVIGLGQLLAGDDRITLRVALGRALCSGAIGASAMAAPLIWPDIAPGAQAGLICAFASCGTSAVEALIDRIRGKK
jgi:hypothetical protein